MNFRVEISMGGEQECRVSPPSDWIVTVKWFGQDSTPHYIIETKSKSTLPYPDFYADVSARVEGEDESVPLSKSVKGTYESIKIRTEFEELGLAMENSISGVEELLGRFLKYNIQLSPILKLSRDISYQLRSDMNKENVKFLIQQITQLQVSPDFEHLFDMVLISGDTSIRAHKCILSARLPRFTPRLHLVPRREDGLDEIRIESSGEPGLPDMIQYIYSNQFPMQMIPLGNLAATAIVMNSYQLMSLIFDKYLEKLTVNNVLLAIFFTDLHGAISHQRKAMRYMLENLAAVQATREWVFLEATFYLLYLNANEYPGVSILEMLKLALKTHVKSFYML